MKTGESQVLCEIDPACGPGGWNKDVALRKAGVIFQASGRAQLARASRTKPEAEM